MPLPHLQLLPCDPLEWAGTEAGAWILEEQILRKITGNLTFPTGNVGVKMAVQLGLQCHIN